MQLSPDLVEFIESGVSLVVGTRSAALRPECMRAIGVQVTADRSEVIVYLPTALAGRMLANIDDNRQIALTCSRPIDHKTLQLKGQVREHRASAPAERSVQERYLAGFVEQLYCVGMARSLSRRLHYWPSTAVRFAIDSVYQQTPGPGAGRKL